jgi:hypothetical protein
MVNTGDHEHHYFTLCKVQQQSRSGENDHLAAEERVRPDARPITAQVTSNTAFYPRSSVFSALTLRRIGTALLQYVTTL